MLVTKKGLAYEQRKDSYRRATLLGTVLIGAGALFAFYGYRIRQTQQKYNQALMPLRQIIERLAGAIQRLPGQSNTTALRQWLAQQNFGQFDDSIRLGKRGQIKISIPIFIMILGAIILLYSIVMSERWLPPRDSFVSMESRESKRKGRKGRG